MDSSGHSVRCHVDRLGGRVGAILHRARIRARHPGLDANAAGIRRRGGPGLAPANSVFVCRTHGRAAPFDRSRLAHDLFRGGHRVSEAHGSTARSNRARTRTQRASDWAAGCVDLHRGNRRERLGEPGGRRGAHRHLRRVSGVAGKDAAARRGRHRGPGTHSANHRSGAPRPPDRVHWRAVSNSAAASSTSQPILLSEACSEFPTAWAYPASSLFNGFSRLSPSSPKGFRRSISRAP